MKKITSMKKPALDLGAEALNFAQETQQHHAGDDLPPALSDLNLPMLSSDAEATPGAMGLEIAIAENGFCQVMVTDCMTIYEAAQQKIALLQILNEHTHMDIDLSNVNEMDTAGLQILLLLKRTAEKTGKTLRLVAQSPATLDVLDRYNLDNFFSDLGNVSEQRNISGPENIGDQGNSSEHGNISSTNH